jgi:hypothetical protein
MALLLRMTGIFGEVLEKEIEIQNKCNLPVLWKILVPAERGILNKNGTFKIGLAVSFRLILNRGIDIK